MAIPLIHGVQTYSTGAWYTVNYSTGGTTGTWTAPTGTTDIIFECWGGGGSGGGSEPILRPLGNGAAGGQYAKKTVSGSLGGNAYTYGVAATKAGISGGNGSTGNDSFIQLSGSDVCRAKGGAGGTFVGRGVGSTTEGVGDTIYAGGSGAIGTGGVSGGGGSGAGSTGTGNSAVDSIGGTAKSEYGGAGGNGTLPEANGGAGSQAGGGGAGSASTDNSMTGGTGAAGRIRIQYFI